MRKAPFGTRRSKYRNVKVKHQGMTFDSKRELADWQKLELLHERGVIRGLTRQVRYPLQVNGERIGTYVADFVFEEQHAGKWFTVCADSKGFATREYMLKKALMRAIHGIEVREL